MKNILIVEDDAIIADTISYALETESFVVTWVNTGKEALSLLRETEHIHLVLLDIGLPDINGFEVLKQIRAHSEIPVIFTTARDDEIDKVLGLELGADDYVTKPLSPRELVARVKANLKRIAPNLSSPQKNNSDFEVNLKTLIISCQGKNLSLTKAEFTLLKYLLSHPQQVFSRDQLLTAIWDNQYLADERTIDTHVKSLRSKLKSTNPNQEYIQTHRGLGYSILLQ